MLAKYIVELKAENRRLKKALERQRRSL
jgi:hypothetical protein